MSTKGLPRRLARRHLMKLLAVAGGSVALWGRPSSRAWGQDDSPDRQASLMTWPGYDRAEFYQPYIALHGTAPALTLFDDLDQAHSRLLTGWRGDLLHPCFEVVEQWRSAGYLQAIDTNRLSHWGGIFPRLRDLPGTRNGWESWFIPFDWGQTSLVYRTDVVRWTDGVESWSLLWDDRYKGRIGFVDMAQDAWWSAAIYSGVTQEKLDGAGFREVRQALDRLSLQTAPIGSPADLERGFVEGNIVAALAWSDSAARLRRQGLPVAFADPVEGALTWCCGLVMHRAAGALDKAYDLIDGLISAEAGARVIEAFGFGHANRLAFDEVGDQRLAALGLPIRPLATLDRAVFLEPQKPHVINRIERDWAEVTGRPQARRRFRDGASRSGDSE